MRVCIRKSDNRIIESQSGGGADDYDVDELTIAAIQEEEARVAAQNHAAAELDTAIEAGEEISLTAEPVPITKIDAAAIRQQVADEISARVAHNLDVLLQNAIAAGYSKDDVTVMEMDSAAFVKRMADQAEVDKPPPLTKQQRITEMLQQHGLTVADLKAALA